MFLGFIVTVETSFFGLPGPLTIALDGRGFLKNS